MPLRGEAPCCTQVLVVLAVEEERAPCFSGGGVEERSDPLQDFCCRARTARMGGLLGELAPGVAAGLRFWLATG